MASKITIKIIIPVDRFGCPKCQAEKIARYKELIRCHVRKQVKELLGSINETEDKKSVGVV